MYNGKKYLFAEYYVALGGNYYEKSIGRILLLNGVANLGGTA